MANSEHNEGPEYLRSRDDLAGAVKRCVGLLLTMGASYSDAEEAVQSAVIRAWRYPKRDEVEDHFAFLRRCAVNAYLNLRRKDIRRFKREQRAFTDRSIAADPGTDRSPETRAVLNEGVEEALASLRTLPPAQREAYVLRVEGMGYGEIAELTGRSEAAVRQNMSRAKEALESIKERKRPQRG